MRKAIAVVAAGLTCSAGLMAATAEKKTSQTKTTAAPKAHGKTTSSTSRAQKSGSRAPHAVHSTWHPGQTAPTPERYREVQEALAKKGYLQGDASGVWNHDSADALRRFQQDQNLQPSGKLDSLSIIALGLGPKY